MGTLRLLLCVAGTIFAAGPLSNHAQEKKWTPPNFIRELRYTCYPDKVDDLIAYFTRLAEADIKINSGRMRWMDGYPYGQLVIAGIRAYHLEEYDTRVGSGTVFAKAFGEDEYRKFSTGYSNAQMRTESVIRKYRNDLSMNREKHAREGIKATAYLFVTIVPGKNQPFGQLWLRALSAYKKVAPAMIISAAQTLAGGGPQYVFARPLKSYAEFETDLAPEEAVERAFGKREAETFSRLVSESVSKWETLVFDRGNADTNVR